MKREAPLLAEVDKIDTPMLVPLILGEIRELVAELNTPDQNIRSEISLGELNDVMVFYYSLLIALGLEHEVEYVPGWVDKKIAGTSSYFDGLSEAVSDLKPVKAHSSAQRSTRDHINRLLLSLIEYSYISSENSHAMIAAFNQTIAKVLRNRLGEFYSVYENGKKLNREEITRKYRFLELFQRRMRNFYGRNLTVDDWVHVEQLARSWRQGFSVIAPQLDAKLQLLAKKRHMGNSYGVKNGVVQPLAD